VSPIFLIPYIVGPLIGGMMAAGLSKLATLIYNKEDEDAENES
jgi:ethanolamine transporter EutH